MNYNLTSRVVRYIICFLPSSCLKLTNENYLYLSYTVVKIVFVIDHQPQIICDTQHASVWVPWFNPLTYGRFYQPITAPSP